LKYSLFYGRPGERLVGYDNERGWGDHRHLAGKEEPYSFSTPEQFIADFLADVRRLRGEWGRRNLGGLRIASAGGWPCMGAVRCHHGGNASV